MTDDCLDAQQYSNICLSAMSASACLSVCLYECLSVTQSAYLFAVQRYIIAEGCLAAHKLSCSV